MTRDEYAAWVEARSRELIEGGVATEDALRELLILSVHSGQAAGAYFQAHLEDGALLSALVKIALDEDGYEGDGPMAAAYWLEQYPVRLLGRHGARLLRGFPVQGAGHNVLLALALAKTGEQGAAERIAEAHAAGELSDEDHDRALARLGAPAGR